MRIEQRGNEIVVGPKAPELWKETHEIRCPKCDADARYVGVAYCIGDQGEDAGMLCFGVPQEHLHVVCQRCHFVWLMETKDEAEKRMKASLEKRNIMMASVNDMKHISQVMQSPGLTFLQPQHPPKE